MTAPCQRGIFKDHSYRIEELRIHAVVSVSALRRVSDVPCVNSSRRGPRHHMPTMLTHSASGVNAWNIVSMLCLASGLLGGLTIVGWVIALVVGPVATVQLWRFRQSGRRAGIVLFGYGLAYYLVGLLALRSPEASTRQIFVAVTMFALPLVLVLLPRTRLLFATAKSNVAG
jgi:hypothetical protein